MDKSEFMKLTGKSVTQTRKLCDKGKTSKLDIRSVKEEKAAQLESKAESMAELKARKLEAEIANLQQRLQQRQEKIEKEYESAIITRLIEVLKPLEKAFKECSLNQEQTNLLNNALNESMTRLKALLNG